MFRMLSACAIVGASIILVTGCDGTASNIFPIAPSSAEVVTVRISTKGADADLDHDGYVLNWDGGTGRLVAVQDSVNLYGLPAGEHSVRLDGLSGNCKVTGDNPVKFELGEGSGSIPVSFSVSCLAVPSCEGCWDY